MKTLTPVDQTRRARRLAWVAIAFASLSIVLVGIGRSIGGAAFHWTAWAGPIVLIGNTIPFLLPQARKYPRATTAYYVFTAIASLIVLAAVLWRLWHRGATI